MRGTTVPVRDVREWYPEVLAVAALTRSGPVSINAYLTAPNAEGLPPHKEDYDVLVLMMLGSKTFTVDGDEIVLDEGDTLFIPRRTTHHAIAGPRGCLNLSVGFQATRGKP